jgi:hypothetical protein
VSGQQSGLNSGSGGGEWSAECGAERGKRPDGTGSRRGGLSCRAVLRRPGRAAERGGRVRRRGRHGNGPFHA